MKSIRFRRFLAGLSASLVLAASVATLTACNDAATSATDSDTEPTVTLPDLADEREPTASDAYADRLNTAFADSAETPAEQFTYIAAEGAITVTAYTGSDSVVVIPAKIEDMPVVSISEDAFSNAKTVKKLSIPDTVTDIARGALAGCTELTTLRTPRAAAAGEAYFGSLFGAASHETNGSYVPDQLATLIWTAGDAVSAYAFYDCNFEAVFLPAGVTAIGDFAFYGNESLVYLPLADTALETVGEHAFTNCRSLLSLELPATVNAMGFAMLEGCGALETLAIPFVGASRGTTDLPAEDGSDAETEDADVPTTDHLGYLFGARAYVHSAGYMPASLITVTLLEGCGDIPANAFFECASIRTVVLPEGVSTIGRRAFYGCAKLSNITLPDSVTGIGDDAFHGCIRLVDLTVGEGLTTLGVQAFMDCLSLRTVTLPAGVTHLSNSAFAGCRSLESFTAPGVVSQGDQVFRHCDKLTDVILAPVNA